MMNTTISIARLPKLPTAPRQPKPLFPCECGCGLTTQRRFAPGHDSRLRAWALRVERGHLTIANVRDLAGRGTALATWKVTRLGNPAVLTQDLSKVEAAPVE